VRIHLDETFVEGWFTGEVHARRALVQVLASRLRGDHLYTVEVASARRLAAAMEDGESLRLVLEMERDFVFLGDDADNFGVWASLTGGGGIFEVLAEPSGFRYVLSADVFLNSRLFEPLHLVLENIDERKFLDAVLDWYVSDELRRPALVTWMPINGGGDTIDRVIFADPLRPRLALVDSDRCCAECNVGQTCRKALRAARRSGGRIHITCYPGREIENLIPPNLVREAMRTTAGIQEIVDRVVLVSTRVPEFLRYFDWKKGLSSRTLTQLADDRQAGTLWRAVAQAVAEARLGCWVCRSPLDEAETACLGGCTVIPGVGGSLLDHVSRHVAAQSIGVGPTELRDDWINVARRVFAWAVSAPAVLA